MKGTRKEKADANAWGAWISQQLTAITLVLSLVPASLTILKLWDGDTYVAVRIAAFWVSLVAWMTIARHLSGKVSNRWVRGIGWMGFLAVPLLVTYSVGESFLWWEMLPRGKLIVAVADISGPDGERYGVTDTVLRDLRRATRKYDDVVVVPLRKAVTERDGGSKRARELGEEHGASIVLWGYYQKTSEMAPVTMYFEMFRKPSKLVLRSESETLPLPLEELESLRVVTGVSDQMKYLTLLAEGMIRYERDDYRGAIEILTAALEQGKVPPEIVSPADLYFCRGCAYSLVHDCEMALLDYDKAIAVDGEYGLAYRDRAVIYLLRGDVEKARRDGDRAVTLRPGDCACRQVRAFTELFGGDAASALIDSIEAAHLDPKDPQNHNLIGFCRFMMGDLSESIAEYTLAIAVDQTQPEFFVNRGLSYCTEGDLDRATLDLETALRLDDKELLAYVGLQALSEKKGEYEKAIRYSDIAISKGKANEMIYFNRAI